jgi:ABC-type bacteriocin/lantibiotic exporter with double-glycine peptidase domain
MPAELTAASLPVAGEAHSFPEVASRGSFKRRVVALMLTDKASVKWMLAAALLESLVGLTGPWLSAQVIDTALPNEASDTLAIIVVLVLVAALHVAWAGWLRERIMATLLTRVEAQCLTMVLDRFLQTDYRLSSRCDFGGTQETMAAVSTTSSAVIRALLDVATQLLSALSMLTLLAVWFPELAVAVVASLVLMLLPAGAYALREARLAQATLAISSRQRQMLHVLLSAAATLRVLGATDRTLNDWRRQLISFTHASVEQEGAKVGREVVVDTFPKLVGLGATAWFVSDVMSGQASLGQMMMGVVLISGVAGALVGLTSTVLGFLAQRPQFQRVDDLLLTSETTTGVRSQPDASCGHEQPGGLALHGVWFRYAEGTRWVLGDYSAQWPAQQLTELRARSGAGKTTILRLLAGLVEPDHGTVRVLGRNPATTPGLVSYLPQNSMLLEASIATNLRVLSGRPLEESLELAMYTGLADLLQRLPMGVETVVSVAGANLSAGQRQLVLLTAAFASQRPVVLLDEATSQLDEAAKQAIDWPRLSAGRTVIVVRHE